MTRTQRKNFRREIKSSLGRFLSILLMSALGVGFFTGLSATEPDMKDTVDVYLDGQDFMDVRVMGTLGLTDEDVEAIAAVDGVKDAEGAWSGFFLSEIDENKFVIQVLSLTERLSREYVVEGRAPQASGECLLDTFYAGFYGIGIGDRITLSSGTDEDISESLATDTFTVTGLGWTPYYLAFDRDTAQIGSGNTDCFIIITPEDCVSDVYTQVYVTADDVSGLNCFTDEYDEAVDAVQEDIEAIEEGRCEVRWDEVYTNGQQEIEDAKRELDDAQAELDDGAAELADARAELDDAAAELASGREELDASRDQLADARRQLDEGRAQLDEAQAQLDDTAAQLDEAKAELDAAAPQLDAAEQALEESADQLEASRAQLDEALARVEAGEAAYAQGSAELAAAQAELDAQREQVEAQLAAVEQAGGPEELAAQLRNALAQIEAAQHTLDEKAAELAAARAELDAGRSEYDAGMAAWQEGQAQYEAGLAEYTQNRDAYEQGLDAYEEGYEQYLAGAEAFRAALAEYEENRAAYERGYRQYRQAERDYEQGLAEYEDGEAEYEEGMQEYLDALAEFEEEAPDARAQIADAEEKLAELEYPEWYVLDRNTIPSYVEFDQDARSMGNLAKVFPLIFFLVAALVSLTTMTRMVEEERTEIGTMKALGFSTLQIAQKYVFYALAATVSGGIIGMLAGEKVLPYVIIMAYKIMYENIPGMVLTYRPLFSVIAVLAAVLCNVLAAIAAANRAMTAVPAELMRPRGPKAGKRIWLEYITPLWSRLNFSFKSALRNLFRYKKRLVMTVLGIGACMGLMLVGYGLRDSIQDIVNNQYQTIFCYDAAAGIDSDASEAQLADMRESIGSDELVTGSLGIYREAADLANSARTLSGYLMVPEETESLPDFIGLREYGTKEAIDIADGAVITVKMSRLMGLAVGDSFSLTVEGETREVTVAAIAENYTYHYVYLAPQLYEELFGRPAVPNEMLINLTEDTAENRSELGERLIRLKAVGNVEFSYELNRTIVNMMKSLDFVVWVLILSAGLLAFIVLYNLNNISITERRRELATLKVLGFYDREVSMYVFRENIFLTAAGMVLGCIIGYGLFHYVVNTVEIDMMLFGRVIRPASYVYSVLWTLLFSVLVNAAMVFRIRLIDMVESLKSME